MFSLMTSFPMAVLRSRCDWLPPRQTPRRRQSGRRAGAQSGPWPVSVPGRVRAAKQRKGDPTVALVTDDLMARARDGDGEAFRELTEPPRAAGALLPDA